MRTRNICLILAALFIVLGAGAAFAGVADLGGTSWRVVAYNVGKVNTLTPVEGEHVIHVVFGKNGHISGSGVNGFTANYSAMHSRSSGRNSIEIRNTSLGNRHKYSNTAMRNQEREILEAMRGAVSYRMAGGQLDLLYRNGRIAATLLTTDEISVETRRENILSHANLAVPYDQRHLEMAKHVATYTVYRNGLKEATIVPNGPDAVILTIDGENFHLTRLLEAGRVRYIDRNDHSAELWESEGKTTIIVRGDINSDFVPVY